MPEITHKPDEHGKLRQIVPPRVLREILDADGDDHQRPQDLDPDDQWDVDE